MAFLPWQQSVLQALMAGAMLSIVSNKLPKVVWSREKWVWLYFKNLSYHALNTQRQLAQRQLVNIKQFCRRVRVFYGCLS